MVPSLDVVAISQAPSPELNPDSPLPVSIILGLYPTIKIDGTEANFTYLYKHYSLNYTYNDVSPLLELLVPLRCSL